MVNGLELITLALSCFRSFLAFPGVVGINGSLRMFMTGTLRSRPVMPDCRSTWGLLEGVFKLCSLRVSSLFKDRVTELRTCGASVGVHVFLPTNFCFSLMFFSMLLKPPNQLLRCPSRDKLTTSVVGS